MKIAFHGVVENGKFQPEKPERFKGAFVEHEGKRVTVAVAAFKKHRSNNQNAFLHGVVYPAIVDETGNDKEAVHEALKQMFLVPRFVDSLGVYVTGSTKDLSTKEFEEYIEKIRAWSVEKLGVRIPTPNEVEF